MKKRSIFACVLFTIILTGLIFTLGFTRKSYANNPTELYQVYLHGKSIGVIEDVDKLYNLIDKEQESLKKKYDVNKIYAPSGLEVSKIYTYTGKIQSEKEIYEEIKDKESFTLKGYKVKISDGENDPITLNLLNKDDLNTSIDKTIKAFVKETDYNAYLNNTQEKITDVGSTIENVSIKENITIKEDYISTNDLIFTNSNDLSKYLLFGTLENQSNYTVSLGDTIEEVAYNNGLNTIEFLIANPNIKSENSLLYTGQVVNIALINPIISIVVDETTVELQEIKADTVVEYDNTITVGTSYVKEAGQSGQSKVTFKTQSVNGDTTNVVKIKDEEITPAIAKVIVKGGLSINYSGDGNWAWPTIRPYYITSYYGWRWGKLHGGIDISGTGMHSPIYASTDGVVTSTYSACANNGYYGSSCGRGYGNHVTVKTTSGYTIFYAHLTNDVPVSVGQTIYKGQTIGFMGNSGSSTGTHLHFEVQNGSGSRVNPCNVGLAC